MTDLHGWIRQKIDEREALARQAAANGADWTVDLPMRAIRTAGDFAVATTSGTWAWHIAANDPAVVLRRCAADRKILEIHRYKGGSWEPYACDGCGADDVGALVDHANDCPTLVALAEGYGITADELAQLDRPQPDRPVNLYKSYADQVDAYCRRLDDLLRPTNPTSAVPAALRGPNWKGRP